MRPSLDTDFFGLPTPRAIAHRGACGTHPENTMASFEAAAALGANYFELDVHMTRDGEVVVCHDPDLARTTGTPGLIKQMAYRDVATADAACTFSTDGTSFPFRAKGIMVPRLAEVLAAFANVRAIVEVKQTEPSLIDALLSVIDGAGARRRVLVASEHQAPLDEFRALAPDIPTNFSSGEVGGFMQALAARDRSYPPAGDALEVPPSYEGWRLVTPESVAFAHECGVEVHVWTVNEPAEMTVLLEMGVDGIITDFPARLLELLGHRSRR